MNERCLNILKMLCVTEHIDIAYLASALGVSAVTVRKDCAYLEEQGLLRKEHGYIMPISFGDIRFRMALQYEEKKKIAKRAAQMVQNGETIMIESGSTCALLAAELCETKHDVTLISNSAYIAEYVRDCKGVRVTLLGGTYNSDAQAMTGPLVKLCAKEFYVDKFFTGSDGCDIEQGFSSEDLMIAEAARAMAGRAAKRIVLMDASKFNKRSVVMLMNATEVSAVITNSVPPNCKKYLEGKGVEIVLV